MNYKIIYTIETIVQKKKQANKQNDLKCKNFTESLTFVDL